MRNGYIFLHIEKSAGTSFRQYFRNKIGYNNVYWWNNTNKHVTYNDIDFINYPVVGGHRDYTSYSNPNRVFLAVLREPFERVLSLYNYHSTVDISQAKGFDPQNFDNTISNCPDFIKKITAGQCRYLSGATSFSATKKTISKQGFAIGTYDNIDLYTSFIANKMKLSTSDFPLTNVAGNNYAEKITLSKKSKLRLEKLLAEDYKLYELAMNRTVYSNVKDEDWLPLNNLNGIRSLEIKKQDIVDYFVENHSMYEFKAMKLLDYTFKKIRSNLDTLEVGDKLKVNGLGIFTITETGDINFER